MEILYANCCGLDVHKKTITACIITPKGKELRTFGTFTADLLDLADWIKAKDCTHVAMESTGVYWKPIYNILEQYDLKEILVVNAQHIKTVPGRKTDVKDADWSANLLRHGLLRGSFIQNREQRELKELVGYRKSLVDERAREVNRIQKVLEGAGIKLASVATDITGVSGRAILDAIVSGIDDPKFLASLSKGRLKNKREQLEQALHGLVGRHQRMLLSTQLQHIDFLDREIAKLDQEVEGQMRPFEQEIALLDGITGIGVRSAQVVLACIGRDMSRFPTKSHISSWAGLSPGNNESAGKRRKAKTTKGNPLLRTTMIQAAKSASHTKNTYLSAQYHRIAARRGKNKAAVAVAHTILVIIYCMLKNHTPYQDMGADYFAKVNSKAIAKRAIKQLEMLGYQVKIEAA
ncbi:Transposase IS116/IS110/IS902 family protein [Pelotomaculum sp. FP]|nr:IS110 family transposase [Pelotomaculum sp. FP]TEB09387.1 Transposase IS116/IS110/IS902 family protein [Pelotomaculum sp. FP]